MKTPQMLVRTQTFKTYARKAPEKSKALLRKNKMDSDLFDQKAGEVTLTFHLLRRAFNQTRMVSSDEDSFIIAESGGHSYNLTVTCVRPDELPSFKVYASYDGTDSAEGARKKLIADIAHHYRIKQKDLASFI